MKFTMITLFWVFLVAMVAPALAVTSLTIVDAFKAHKKIHSSISAVRLH
jgi:hypothetical protein